MKEKMIRPAAGQDTFFQKEELAHPFVRPFIAMQSKKAALSFLIIAAILYVAMIAVNALANILPLNGVTTGAVSDEQFNLFAPAGLTFSIWGVIYLLLGVYLVREFRRINTNPALVTTKVAVKVNLWFAVSSLANALWIFTWHFRKFGLSVLLMAVILVALVAISTSFPRLDAIPKVAFGVYFAWITVAMIANVTTWLVSLGVPNLTAGATLLMIIVLYVGLGIAVAVLLIQKNLAYGLVILWAFIGILVRHLDSALLAGEYPTIITTLWIAIAAITAAEGFTVYRLVQERY